MTKKTKNDQIRPFGGPIHLFEVDEQSGVWTPCGYKPHNLVLYEAADIVAKLIAGNVDYAIAAMYFEFTNNSTAAPSPARDEGHLYYDDLDGINKDFIRVSLGASPSFSTSDALLYSFNTAQFMGMTAGTVGHHGLTFSQAAGSEIIGAALAATPGTTFADDLVYSRMYFDTAKQKLDGHQFALTWPMQLT